MKRLLVIACLVGVIGLAAWWVSVERFDLVIRGGTVVDGTGAPPAQRSVCAVAGIVVRCPLFRRYRGATEIDGRGRIVAPGFIDAHTHVERNLPVAEARPFTAWSFVVQGVTTVVTGNCGTSVTDVAGLRRAFDSHGGEVNLATFVGHNSLRTIVLGSSPNRPAAGAEVDSMAALLRRGVSDGALGLSVGLGYAPGSFATQRELTDMVAATARAGGMVNFHVRDEGARGAAALSEALGLVSRTGVRAHISHLKAAGKRQWGDAARRLRLIEGVPGVSVDVYPYDASSTDLSPLLPPWFFASSQGGVPAGNGDRQRVKAAMNEILERAGWLDYRFAQVASFWADRSLDGLYLPEVAAKLGLRGESPVEAQQEAIIAMARRGGAQMIYHDLAMPDVDRIMAWKAAVVGSDAGVRGADMQAKPHPRGLGTFPRVIRRYVGGGRMPLEVVIQRMTGMTAAQFGLPGRGTLQPGSWADVVVFNLDSIADRATYDQPLLPPVGIDVVIVNGVVVMRGGRRSQTFPGRFVGRDATVGQLAGRVGGGRQ